MAKTSTSTRGGSTSTSSNHSVTNSNSHTQGGSKSHSFGKSWASGKVNDTTQKQFDKHNQDYMEGEKVSAAYGALQDILNNKPKFESKYEDKLSGLYDQIMNREKFSYDFNADPMYKMYKDNYTTAGKNAMNDTIGQASAMTGGYGSSYAETVGQQQFQNYLQQLNNVLPTLRNEAYAQYRDEGTDLMNKYGITSGAYDRDYGHYRDDVGDWNADRGFRYGAYQDERNFDYGKYRDDRNYWQNEYWNEKNAERSNVQDTDTQSWSDTSSNSTTDSTGSSSTNSWSNSDTMYPERGGGGKTSKKKKEESKNPFAKPGGFKPAVNGGGGRNFWRAY